MKKIIVMFLMTMFLASAGFAQTVIPKEKIHLKIPSDGGGSKFSVMIYYNPSDGQYYYYNPSTYGTNNNLLQDIYEKSDTSLQRLNSVIVKLIEIVNNQTDQINNQTAQINAIKADTTKIYAKVVKGDYTTVSTETDSLTFSSLGYKNWIDGDLYVSDTLKYSFGNSFAAGTVGYAFPGVLTPIGKTEIKDNPKIYFKRHAASGTVSYAYKLRGW